MRFLTLNELLEIHDRILVQSGGSKGGRAIGEMESALAQPRMTFDGQELYPSLAEKAAALGFSIIQNHPFIDGNKRTGHAAVEIFLLLNGFELNKPVDEQEQIILQIASGKMERAAFADWLNLSIVARK